MRYLMKQKLFSLGDKFLIKDENERDAFLVEGKLFSIGNKLSFQDMLGNELVFIKQKLMSWSPTYEIYKSGQYYASIKKEIFTFFNCKFNIEMVGSNSIQVEGNFSDHEYTFMRNGRAVAAISKQWFSWSDTYGIDIEAGEDDAFILACSVTIDMICHDDNKR